MFVTISLVFQGRHTCCTNWITSKVVSFYHMGTKVHINYICQPRKWSPILFSHWLTCLHKVCFIKWKGLEMVDKMCNIFCLKHGRVNKNTMIGGLLWNNQHFLFLFGDKNTQQLKKYLSRDWNGFLNVYLATYIYCGKANISLFSYLWVGR